MLLLLLLLFLLLLIFMMLLLLIQKPSKFGQNRVRNIRDIVVVVVINGDFVIFVVIVDPVQKPILEIW